MLNQVKMRSFLFSIIGTVLLCACDSDGPLVCPASFEPAIAVIVKDSLTGNYYSGQTTVVAQSDTFVDSVTVKDRPQPFEIGVAPNRAGVYTVMIHTQDAYLEWKKSGVVVSRGACSINTVQLAALLQKPPKDTTSDFAIYFNPRDEFTNSMVHVHFNAGDFQLELGQADLGKRFLVPTSGNVRIRYSLISGSDTLGTKEVSFQLEQSFNYLASGYVSPRRYAGSCSDGGLPVALRSPNGGISADTLYLEIGGMPKGGIC